MTLPPGDHRHGTMNGYGNLGCRCKACRRANADYAPGRAARARYRSRATTEGCKAEGCDAQGDRAYVTGYCHRHNIELGYKPDPYR